jgi:hypothetical protein
MNSGLGLRHRFGVALAVVLGGLALTGTAGAVSLPLPADAAGTPNAAVNSISCPAADACAAAGDYTDSAGKSELLLLNQSGSSWIASEGNLSDLVTSSAGINSNHGGLDPESISCASPGNCTVVGEYWDGSADFRYRPFVLSETGGTWGKAEPVSLPANADVSAIFQPYAMFHGVACSSAGNCTAVGTYDATSSGYRYGLVATEAGGVWSVASAAALPSGGAATPSASPNVLLPSVRCTAAGSCEALGRYALASGGNAPLLLTQTNGGWTAATPSLSGLNPTSLTPPSFLLGDWNTGQGFGSLACPAAGNCVAVAAYADHNNDDQGMLLDQSTGWSASTLNLAQLADPAQANGLVNLVSVGCISAGNCATLGTYADHNVETHALLATESGGSWLPASTVPLPSDQSSIDPAVSSSSLDCASAGNCAGVLYYEDNQNNPMAELLSESGGKWATTELATPVPYTDIPPYYNWGDVACAASGYCAVVLNTALDTGASAASSLTALTPPAAATSATASVSGTGAHVSWTVPANTGGLPVTGYTITASDETAASRGGQSVTVGAVSSGTVAGLTPGDTYTFTITPANALGSGLPVSTAGVLVPVPPVTTGPPAPPAPPAPPVTKASISTTQLTASLAGLLTPTGPASRLKKLVHTHGYTFTWTPLEAGTVTVRWYARIGTRRHHHRRLIGSGTTTTTTATATAVHVTLNRTGRRIVKTDRRLHHRLHVTATVSFTSGTTTVTATHTFTLH